MEIECNRCGARVETNLGFFVKLIGGSLPLGGFMAWVTYFFAGTGLALPICIAIVTGGTAMLVFKDEIVEWIVDAGYECTSCGARDWTAR